MKFYLTGAHEGKTINLGTGNCFHFVEGVMEVPGSYQQNEGLAVYLWKCFQAVPEFRWKEIQDGKRDADEGRQAVQGGVQPPRKGTRKLQAVPGVGNAGAEARDPGLVPAGD